MNTQSDFDRRASAWLVEGPTELADRVLDAALREVHLTHQRRRWAVPWRTQPMSFQMRAGALIAIVAVAGLAALALLNRGPGFGAPATLTPTETPVPTAIGPTPFPSLSLDTSTWTAFTSSRYGFSARYPATFEAVPSVQLWRMPNAFGNMFDGFRSAGAIKWLDGHSTLLPEGATRDDWYAEYRRDIVDDDVPLFPSEPETCFTPSEEWNSTTVDGSAADLRIGCEAMEAFVFVPGRVYVFGAYGYDALTPPTTEPGVSADLRELFELWLTTITLDPASAQGAGSTPRPSST